MKKRDITIGAIVLAGHLFFFFYHFQTSKTPPVPKHSIVVRTQLPPKPKPKIVASAPPKKNPAPARVQKKTSPGLKQKKPDKAHLLKQIAKTLPSVEVKKESFPEIPLTLPQKINHLQIDQTESLQEETTYLMTLVECFQRELQLPEEGAVRLRITVLQSGRVEKVEVLYAESKQNKSYLEKALISLALPPFSGELAHKKNHTFTLNFRDEL